VTPERHRLFSIAVVIVLCLGGALGIGFCGLGVVP
jgi:hypothetical protein